MKKVALLLIVMATLLLSVGSVLAATPGEAEVSGEVNRGEYSLTAADQDVDLTSGNIRYTDLTTNMSTYRWAGLLGNVSGNIVLGDSSNDVLFSWTANGRIVYASTGSPTWASLVVANASTVQTYINGTDSDNFTNTFNSTATVDSGIFPSLTNAPTATTNGGAGWFTYALYDGANMVWAGNVRAAGDTAYDTTTSVQYQMIVPEDGTSGDTSATSYNLWVELV